MKTLNEQAVDDLIKFLEENNRKPLPYGNTAKKLERLKNALLAMDKGKDAFKTWHTNKERPDEGAEILIKTKDRLFSCVFACGYLGNFEVYSVGGADDCIPNEDVIQWAYTKDILAMR